MRPEGPKRFYSLRAEPFMEMDASMAQFRSLWSARPDSPTSSRLGNGAR